MVTESRSAYGRHTGQPVGSASGPASVVLAWWGRRVGGLGPGLTSDSADAARAVLRTICRPGPGSGTTGAAGLICLACARGRGCQVRRPAVRAIPQPEKRDDVDHRRDTRRYRRRGHPCGHARRRGARSDRRAARRGGVPGDRGRLRPAAGLAGRVRDRVPGRGRGDRQLRRRPGPAHGRGRCPGRRGGPLRPAGPPPPGQVRPAGRRQRRPGRPVRPGPRRAEGPRRRGRGDPRADGRQAQRPLRADPDDQPGQGPDRDRAR